MEEIDDSGDRWCRARHQQSSRRNGHTYGLRDRSKLSKPAPIAPISDAVLPSSRRPRTYGRRATRGSGERAARDGKVEAGEVGPWCALKL